ncbi:hypothetical protein [Pontixanthobacter luteolus]|uniref:hypothetical protein n=1 Tax=Pontixanthobacter luteolus TaxID=295089 RepID=UPI002302D0DF|nr:hypothetical protein [Pontixanthobacter luteolus]
MIWTGPSIRLCAIGAALSAIAAAGPAPAQDFSGSGFDATGRQQLEVVAVGQPVCNVSPGSASALSNATFTSEGASGGTVSITNLSNPQTALAQPVNVQVEVPVICNSAHEITVRSANGGLQRAGGTRDAVGGFVQFLPYQVRFDWAGQVLSGQSDDGAELAMSIPNAGEGALLVDVALDGSDAPLVAGAYEDTLQIEITAAN